MSMAAALCYGSRGGGASLAFHHHPDAYDSDSLIQALGELRGLLAGRRRPCGGTGCLPTQQGDGAWLRRQWHWLVVEPLPGSRPS